MSTLTIPGYEISREIGEGGMAHVYEAIQVALERSVAIKVLAPDLMADKEFRNRFLTEGKIIANLNHPHIVTIYDFGTESDHYYMVMELITGGTLHERIVEHQLSHKQSLSIIKQIGQALDFAHSHELVHRDVKPANVLFRDPNTAVLGDFGIAKALNTNSQMTQVGLAIGTPDYMSPEQAAAMNVTSQSDLYSLGVMAFEMLTGRVPYFSQSPVGIAARHLEDPIPKLPDELTDFQPLIDRLLARDPLDRFETASDMVLALENLEGSARIRPKGSTSRTEIIDLRDRSKSEQKSPRWIWITAALVTLSAIAGWGVIQFDVAEKFRTAMAPKIEWIPPSAEIEAQVNESLELADIYLEANYLMQPPGSNAYEIYQEVLGLNPNNPDALAGIEKIADSYEKMARVSVDNGDTDDAELMIDEGLSVNPKHEGLLALRERLNQI